MSEIPLPEEALAGTGEGAGNQGDDLYQAVTGYQPGQGSAPEQAGVEEPATEEEPAPESEVPAEEPEAELPASEEEPATGESAELHVAGEEPEEPPEGDQPQEGNEAAPQKRDSLLNRVARTVGRFVGTGQAAAEVVGNARKTNQAVEEQTDGTVSVLSPVGPVIVRNDGEHGADTPSQEATEPAASEPAPSEEPLAPGPEPEAESDKGPEPATALPVEDEKTSDVHENPDGSVTAVSPNGNFQVTVRGSDFSEFDVVVTDNRTNRERQYPVKGASRKNVVDNANKKLSGQPADETFIKGLLPNELRLLRDALSYTGEGGTQAAEESEQGPESPELVALRAAAEQAAAMPNVVEEHPMPEPGPALARAMGIGEGEEETPQEEDLTLEPQQEMADQEHQAPPEGEAEPVVPNLDIDAGEAADILQVLEDAQLEEEHGRARRWLGRLQAMGGGLRNRFGQFAGWVDQAAAQAPERTIQALRDSIAGQEPSRRNRMTRALIRFLEDRYGLAPAPEEDLGPAEPPREFVRVEIPDEDNLGDEPAPEPAAEPPVEPAAEPPVEPAAEPPVEPAAEPPVEPAAEPPVEPAAEPPVEPAAEPPVEPAAEPPVEPAAEPPVEPAAEPPVEPAAEPPVEPAAEPPVEPAAEPPVEPAAEPPVEPAAEPPVEPAAEPPVEPAPIPEAGAEAEAAGAEEGEPEPEPEEEPDAEELAALLEELRDILVRLEEAGLLTDEALDHIEALLDDIEGRVDEIAPPEEGAPEGEPEDGGAPPEEPGDGEPGEEGAALEEGAAEPGEGPEEPGEPGPEDEEAEAPEEGAAEPEEGEPAPEEPEGPEGRFDRIRRRIDDAIERLRGGGDGEPEEPGEPGEPEEEPGEPGPEEEEGELTLEERVARLEEQLSESREREAAAQAELQEQEDETRKRRLWKRIALVAGVAVGAGVVLATAVPATTVGAIGIIGGLGGTVGEILMDRRANAALDRLRSGEELTDEERAQLRARVESSRTWARRLGTAGSFFKGGAIGAMLGNLVESVYGPQQWLTDAVNKVNPVNPPPINPPPTNPPPTGGDIGIDKILHGNYADYSQFEGWDKLMDPGKLGGRGWRGLDILVEGTNRWPAAQGAATDALNAYMHAHSIPMSTLNGVDRGFALHNAISSILNGTPANQAIQPLTKLLDAAMVAAP